MKETTLCYIEKSGSYLMLLRNKKREDPNEGKWIGVGGKLEEGETPEECLCREVREETDVTLTSYRKRGCILFRSDVWENELMHLYTASGYEGEILTDCEEGSLKWIPLEEIPALNLWEGDRIFLERLMRGLDDISLTLVYEGEKLVKAEENM